MEYTVCRYTTRIYDLLFYFRPELEDPAVREHGSFLALNLLRSCLPFIKQAPKKDDSEAPAPATSSDNAASLAGQASQPDDEKSSSLADPARLPEEVLLHLCNLLDTDSTEPKVKLLVQEIVTEGVVVFFPDSKARMEYLFSMIGSVMVSWCTLYVVLINCCYDYYALKIIDKVPNSKLLPLIHINEIFHQSGTLFQLNFLPRSTSPRRKTNPGPGGSSSRLCASTSARSTPSLSSTSLQSLTRYMCMHMLLLGEGWVGYTLTT